MLCPAELLAHIQFLFVSVTPAVENPPNVRRRTLYPGEVRGLIQRIFHFTRLLDSNDSIFRNFLFFRCHVLFLFLTDRSKSYLPSLLIHSPRSFKTSTSFSNFYFSSSFSSIFSVLFLIRWSALSIVLGLLSRSFAIVL